MDPVNITLCGTPSPETLADLFGIALRDGLGFILPPRQQAVVSGFSPKEPARPARRALRAEPAPQRAITGETSDRRTGEPEKPAKVSAPAGVTTAERTETATKRRDAIIGQLRRVGDRGLSFKALLDAMRPHLTAAGDQDQQVAALRNALSTLGRDERVRRVAGQWIACD